MSPRPVTGSALLELRPIEPAGARESRRAWSEFRREAGHAPGAFLTPPSGQPKLGKALTPSWGLTLLPARLAGFGNLCTGADGCIRPCLNTAGRGRFDSTQRGRLLRTRFVFEHPSEAMGLVIAELDTAVRRHGRILFRPNVLSDIAYELACPALFGIRGVQLYDYTKRADRLSRLPRGYRVALSAGAHTTPDDIVAWSESGARVAVVVAARKGDRLPRRFLDLPAVDADASDEWMLKARPGTVGLLRPKGAAMRRLARAATWNRPSMVKPVEGGA